MEIDGPWDPGWAQQSGGFQDELDRPDYDADDGEDHELDLLDQDEREVPGDLYCEPEVEEENAVDQSEEDARDIFVAGWRAKARAADIRKDRGFTQSAGPPGAPAGPRRGATDMT